MKNDIDKMMTIEHENIVNWVDVYYAPGQQKLIVITDLCICPYGQLQYQMEVWSGYGEPLPEPFTLVLLSQVMRGLNAAHEKGFFHLNLRPDNLFLMNDSDIKIGGFATIPKEQNPPIFYQVPEYFLAEQLTSAADIWSVGCIFHELISGQKTF